MLNKKRLPVIFGCLALCFVAHATDYDFYYMKECRSWQAFKKDQDTALPRLPSLNRGDKIALYVVQNTLVSKVTVKFDEESFASKVPDAIAKLLPGFGKPEGVDSAGDKDLKTLADLYAKVYGELRLAKAPCERPTGKPAAKSPATDSTSNLRELVASQINASFPSNDTSKNLVSALPASPLAARLQMVVTNAMSTASPAIAKIFYPNAAKLVTLVKALEDGSLWQSGPFEYQPSQDYLKITMTFSDVPAAETIAPEASPSGGNGGGSVGGHQPDGGTPQNDGGRAERLAPADDKADAAKKAADTATPKKDEPGNASDQVVTKDFYLGSYGFSFLRPSYSAGLGYSTLVDVATRKVTAGGTTTVQPGAKNDWKIVPGAFVHWNVLNKPDYHLGPALGVFYGSDSKLVSYFAGVSLQLGRRTRLAMNFGQQFGEVDVLDGIKFGDTITPDQTLTRKVWRSKWIWSLSYSF